MQMPERTKIQLLAPVVRGRKGEHVKVLDQARKSGYVRVRIDGNLYELSEDIKLDKNIKHNIEIVVDRIVIKEGANKRISEAVDTVSALTGGIIIVDVVGKEEIVFSQNFACPDCGISIGEIEPPNFSFNNPNGACPDCTGLGVKMVVDPDIIVPNKDLSIGKGAICAMGWNNISDPSSGYYSVVTELGKKYGFDMNTPFKDIPEEGKKAILYGCSEPIQVAYMSGGKARVYEFNFDGVIPTIERRYKETTSDSAKEEYMDYMTSVPCPICHGQRLKPEVLAVTLGGKNISQVTEMSIKDIQKFFDNLELNEKQRAIGDLILKEIKARIGFLVDVGLDYLSLSRTAGTLSGGEAQRIRLATQIGSGLVGVLYILDEPSIGLHQRDNDKLLGTLKHLRDIGNSLIVVEHDEDTMRESRKIASRINKMLEDEKYLKIVDKKSTSDDIIDIGDILKIKVIYDIDDIEEYTIKLTGKYMIDNNAKIKEVSLNSPIGRSIYLKSINDNDICYYVNDKKIGIKIIKRIYEN